VHRGDQVAAIGQLAEPRPLGRRPGGEARSARLVRVLMARLIQARQRAVGGARQQPAILQERIRFLHRPQRPAGAEPAKERPLLTQPGQRLHRPIVSHAPPAAPVGRTCGYLTATCPLPGDPAGRRRTTATNRKAADQDRLRNVVGQAPCRTPDRRLRARGLSANTLVADGHMRWLCAWWLPAAGRENGRRLRLAGWSIPARCIRPGRPREITDRHSPGRGDAVI